MRTNTRLTPIRLEQNGIAIKQPDGDYWYPMIGLGQVPAPLLEEMKRRLDAHEQMYNALLVMRLNPTIHAFLQKNDPKALEQVEAALAAAQVPS